LTDPKKDLKRDNIIHEQILKFGKSAFNLTVVDIDDNSLYNYVTDLGYFNVDKPK